MHYILDGYNVIHKSAALRRALDRSLRDARAALVQVCKTILQSRGDIAKITVVFDGKSENDFPFESAGKVEVLFTSTGEDADDGIIDYLRRVSAPQVAVVSDDNYVRNNVRAFAAHVVSTADFMAMPLRRKNGRHAANLNAPDKKIGQKSRDEITRAYAQHLGLGEL